MNDLIKILNIENINSGKINDVLDFCNERLLRGEGAFLIPMNPIKVIKSRIKKDFQSIIDAADWVFPEAWGIKWAAFFLYGKRISLIPGYKLMFSLLKQSEENDRTVYILGTTDAILNIAKLRLRELYPNLRVIGSHNGYFNEKDGHIIFSEIYSLKPDYVFVAMGEYKQEKIINKLKVEYPEAIYLGVGGSIDLMASKQPTPPDWIRKRQLEWLFRLIRQPFRIPRFKALPIFVWLVFIEKVKLMTT